MRTPLARLLLASSASLALLAAACGDDAPAADDPDAPAAPPDARQIPDASYVDTRPGATYWHYVSDKLKVPTNVAEKNAYALDIDGDGTGDNLLGSSAIAMAGNGVDLAVAMDDAVAGGQLILLHSVHAIDLVSESPVTWQIYVGSPQASPDYSGSGSFTVALDSPTEARLHGAIAEGRFRGGPGALLLKLPLIIGRPAVDLTLIGARLEADLTATGCSAGKLGGGILRSEIDDKLLPVVAEMMNLQIGEDCPSGPSSCAAGSRGEALINMFDDPTRTADLGEITLDELKANPSIDILFGQDLDLLDELGQFNPNADGVKESVSIGLGFTCASATFTAPGE